MGNKRPPISDPIKRELRQESKFGCVICGSPIIEYHHINPYHIVKKHEKSNLVVLCPECHHRANCGEIHEEIVREAKLNPKNNNTEYVKKNFFLRNYNNLKLSTGTHVFENVGTIIEIDKFPLIYFNKDENNKPLLNVKLFDENNILQAEIKDNEWIAYKDSNFWDVIYTPGKLKIIKKSRQVFLEFNVLDEIIELKSILYYNGKMINLNNKPMKIGSLTIGQYLVKNSNIGISIDENGICFGVNRNY